MLSYIKYTPLAIVIIFLSSYFIYTERSMSNLKLKEQQLRMLSEANRIDLQNQRAIANSYETRILKNQAIDKKVASIKTNLKKEITLTELIDIRTCELQNINNLDVVCQK